MARFLGGAGVSAAAAAPSSRLRLWKLLDICFNRQHIGYHILALEGGAGGALARGSWSGHGGLGGGLLSSLGVALSLQTCQ